MILIAKVLFTKSDDSDIVCTTKNPFNPITSIDNPVVTTLLNLNIKINKTTLFF